MLGVTWVFGALSFGPGRLVFQYLFSITNSLQGFIIFVVRCLQYPEARNCWVHLFLTGKIKSHRGRLYGSRRSGGTATTHSNVTHTSSGAYAGGGAPGAAFNGGAQQQLANKRSQADHLALPTTANTGPAFLGLHNNYLTGPAISNGGWFYADFKIFDKYLFSAFHLLAFRKI